jgi:thioredoxin-dependent peroxiredoxin
VVLGASADPVLAQFKFKAKYELPFTLLSDVDHKVAEAYGVWQEKMNYGKKYMGIVRTTFVIDKNGKVAHVFEKVKPEGHAAEVAKVVEQLG